MKNIRFLTGRSLFIPFFAMGIALIFPAVSALVDLRLNGNVDALTKLADGLLLRAKCDLPSIGSEDDLDHWLAALRFVASEELKKGNRISLLKGSSKPVKDNKLDEYIVHCEFTSVQSSTVAHLKSYLETISGVSPRLETMEVARLPLFLRNRFSFYTAELFGRPWCLAQEDESWDTGTPGEYEKR